MLDVACHVASLNHPEFIIYEHQISFFKYGPFQPSFSFNFGLFSIPITITVSILSIKIEKSIDGVVEI